jgi:hydroxymethylpyrimidine/phosphomethylpyrimidine kinase
MMKRALTIAGSDPSGGAGIQADLKTFSAFGIYGLSVVTAVTAQNTERVADIAGLDSKFVRLQMNTVLSDMGADGAKTGMLLDEEIVRAVADELYRFSISPLVVDPVLKAKDGSVVLGEKAIEALKNDLIPFATLITPNLPEAEILAGIPVRSTDEMETAARMIFDLGPSAVLVKGGHLEGDPVDVLFDGIKMVRFPGVRIGDCPVHGTGCTLSAAILAGILRGVTLDESVRIAKAYVEAAIRNGFSLGKGASILNHSIPVPWERA